MISEHACAIEEHCTTAVMADSGEKATRHKLARAGMELVWGLKSVLKREVWNKQGANEVAGGSGRPQSHFTQGVTKHRYLVACD